MEIILRQDVDNVGTKGQIVKVSDGYARNFLIPKGFAVTASAANKKMVEDMRSAYLRKESKRTDEAKELAKMLEGLKITIAAKVGEKDHLFGSVTTQDIEKELTKRNFNIERRKIVTDVIKTVGEHKVGLKLHKDVTQEIVVEVVAEA
jgi:large subunit ribosomal protein L9